MRFLFLFMLAILASVPGGVAWGLQPQLDLLDHSVNTALVEIRTACVRADYGDSSFRIGTCLQTRTTGARFVHATHATWTDLVLCSGVICVPVIQPRGAGVFLSVAGISLCIHSVGEAVC